MPGRLTERGEIKIVEMVVSCVVVFFNRVDVDVGAFLPCGANLSCPQIAGSLVDENSSSIVRQLSSFERFNNLQHSEENNAALLCLLLYLVVLNLPHEHVRYNFRQSVLQTACLSLGGSQP